MTLTMGVSGDAGSFSEEAALLYAKQTGINPSLVYLTHMEGVLAAVESSNVDLGIFPVMNLQGGLVKPAFEAMGKHLFTPFDELWLKVEQNLLVLPGTAFHQITKIVSHPQGLKQCRFYLQTKFPGIELVEWIDTARAARDLAEGALPAHTAVIAAKRAAQVYGLEILEKNIQDSSHNLTAFILARKHEHQEEKSC